MPDNSKYEPDMPNNNRQRILDAASQLIAEKGVNHTTVTDIVNRVGISRGTLHYYYKSKNEMIYDITTQHLDQLTSYWLEKASNLGPSGDRLPELLQEILKAFVHAEGPGTLNLYLIHDAVTGNEQLQKSFREKYTEWQQSIVEVLNRKMSGNAQENEILSYIIIAIIDGLTIQWLLGLNDIPFAGIADYLLSD